MEDICKEGGSKYFGKGWGSKVGAAWALTYALVCVCVSERERERERERSSEREREREREIFKYDHTTGPLPIAESLLGLESIHGPI